jgi:predicted ATPase/transcriptional regulator with XRE-family HTH domain/Tfp pilus assembly protein PilF
VGADGTGRHDAPRSQLPTRQVSVGARLQRFRERAGLSQAALAERAGLGLTTLKALEHDRRPRPHPHTLLRLAEALGLRAEDRAVLLEFARGVTDQPTALAQPLASAAAEPSARLVRLPLSSAPLIGRDTEVAAAAAILDPAGSPVRLLTLTGPGGVGKTRLAMAVAAKLAPTFHDSLVFVDLAPLQDPRMVPATIAHVLGLREGNGRSAQDLLLDNLRERQILLVLDSFEHMLGARSMLSEVLRGCPRLAVLVTSRAALRVQGERRFVVAPLVTPDAETDTAVHDISASPAVQLFVACVQAGVRGFALSSETAATVASICRQLEGIPLAIELAAARLPLLSLETLQRRLERRLRVLTNGAADLPQRQQTLRATLAWSYDLLDPAAQLLFRRLAVFVGGWTLEAVEAVCGDSDLPAHGVLDRLQVLVDNSLVRRQEEPRYGMLDTIREYASEKLGASGEIDSIRARHAVFYSRLAEPPDTAAEAMWLWAQSPVLSDQVLDQLATELDNETTALDWFLATSRVAEGLRLAVALNWVWSRRGQYAAGRRWLEAMLDKADRTAPSAAFRAERAVALTEVGTLLSRQGEPEQTVTFFRRSLEEWRQLDHAPGLAMALATLGLAEWAAGDARRAIGLLDEALSRGRAANVPHTVAISLRNLGLVARSQGEYARAEDLFRHAAEQALPAGWYRAYSLARSLSCLGRVSFLQNDRARASARLRQAFEVIRESGLTGQALADCLDWQAALEAVEGDLVRAASLFGAADHQWRTSGARRYLPDQAAYERDLAMARVALGERDFAANWAQGAAMQPGQVIAYALREPTAC